MNRTLDTADGLGGFVHEAATLVVADGLDVQNMTCELCLITVKKALDEVPGVDAATIDLPKTTATVKFDPSRTSVAALGKATTDAGYPSTAHN
jgi:mercuric ion binding protein